jgi:hypothetical protein
MTPEQIAALPIIVSLIEKIGSWPIGIILLSIVICPYIFQWFDSCRRDKQQAAAMKIFEATKRMYEDNVVLVENYAKMANDHVDTIRLSTAATQELTTYLKTRVPCHQFINTNRVAMQRKGQ